MLSWTSFFNTIILLGVIQGFIVCALLFFSKKNARSARLLAGLIFLISLASCKLYGDYMNFFGLAWLRFTAELLPLVTVMPIGPLIYFYVQASLDPAFKITNKERRHFYPVVIDLVPTLLIITYMVGVSTRLLRNNPGPWGSFIDDFNVYADIPRWLSVTFYVMRSAKYLNEFKKNRQGLLNGHAGQVKWLRQFVTGFRIFLIIWLVYLIPYVIPRYTNLMLDTFNWYPIYLPMAVIVYWLGIKGYLISQQPGKADKKQPVIAAVFSADLIKQVSMQLTKAMEQDKLYLNPALSLALVAERTGYPQKTISAVLNQHLQKSFNEFVNHYRIADFKEKILQPEMNNLTIAGIAGECGFNSQATFQRTFKEITGVSPSEFRKTAAVTN